MKDDPTNNNSEGEAVQSMKRKALRSTLLFILVITVVLFTVNHYNDTSSDHTSFLCVFLAHKDTYRLEHRPRTSTHANSFIDIGGIERANINKFAK